MNWRVILAAVLCLASFILGWRMGTPVTEPERKEQVTVVEKKETKTVEKGVTVEVRPDGTKVTRIDERKVERVKEIDAVRVTEVIPAPRPDWSVGLYASVLPQKGTPALTATIDRRISGGLSVGLYGRLSDGDWEAGAGLRFEF